MNKKFENMSYDDFYTYCELRACDGQWDLKESLLCLGALKHLQSIRRTTFMFYSKKKTRKAREAEWEIMKKYM